MSRGGRGGFRGGKGGLDSRIGLDYDPSLDMHADTKPAETFPPIPPPYAEPPSHQERQSVSHYRTLRARIHDGPFYCLLDTSSRISKTPSSRGKAKTTAFFNAFEEQPTYAQRFKKKRNLLPNLSKRPFVAEFFPQELWTTMGLDATGKDTEVKKKLEVSQRTRLDKWMKNTAEEEDGAGEGEQDEEADVEQDEEEEKVEGEEDDADPDQFDEDDEDENDDYNAEQYFEGGDDDDYGDDGGGGGDDDF